MTGQQLFERLQRLAGCTRDRAQQIWAGADTLSRQAWYTLADELAAEQGNTVIVHGNPFDGGFNLVGPFPDYESGLSFAANQGFGKDYWVLQMDKPEVASATPGSVDATWDSVDRCVDWIRTQADPADTLARVATHNIMRGENGFVRDVLAHF